MDPAHQLIPVLEADPDLAAALDEAERIQAGHAALAPALHVECGAWHPPTHAEPGHMGFLVLGGLLCRSVSVAGARSVELLAAGDVIRPWVTLGNDAPSDLDAEWTVIEAAILASLDSEFARRVASWPALCGAIMDRLVIRSRWLALDLALSHVRRVDDRLMLLFWQLGRRVRSEGATTHPLVGRAVLRHADRRVPSLPKAAERRSERREGCAEA